MVGTLLMRGMLIGILAGLLAFAFAKAFGEPQIDGAIAFEDHHHAMAAGSATEPELVSREVQSTFGLLVGVVVYGTAIGGMFALAFAFAYGRIGKLDARATAALLAVLGFTIVILVPQIKYPANPPSVGDSATIGIRTALYFTMIALSLAGLLAAVAVRRRVLRRLGGWNATVLAGAVYFAVVAVSMMVLPRVDEVPPDFSADLLWQFRTASLGVHVVLWSVLGLGFGAVVSRRLATEPKRGSDRMPAMRGGLIGRRR